MSARTFHRLSTRLFALRAAWSQQTPIQVMVTGAASDSVGVVPILIGKGPVVMPAAANGPAPRERSPRDIAA